MIARWGKPKQLISDNASTLKLASSVLEKTWSATVGDSDVQDYLANGGISSLSLLRGWEVSMSVLLE